ncbi:glycosyltransferase [Cyanobium sp. Morenito 9A2]|uniref:glycosyltransferase n=1 Tax=Cyanobium sp. Morenito 9A2 TaxID=2823718 RepID=UPI0020CEDE70|nr:glycosyltransferase [Cyanobium sp. Morenito 9A2]MCP9849782.1 glycosyltransferase [Cyanobium sp. Morenito 9A2]
MRIALTADPELPVPPLLYGGIERIIDLLARELTRRGHGVTLLAHPDSRTEAELVPWPGRSSRSRADTVRNAATLLREVRRRRFDLVHSFSRIAYLLPLLPLPIPKLMSYQRPISHRSIHLAQALSRGSLQFSAISRWMIEPVAAIGHWHLVPNGVELATYPFVADPGPMAPLVFLGRVEAIKGPHLAIEVARRTGLPLVIAGNVPLEHQDWFEATISPQLDEQIAYIGPVDDTQKAILLGSARALLMPILWEEPFGIVMAEAMACGTPVLGFARGVVPEVVEHGVSGFVVEGVEALAEAVGRLELRHRRASRGRVERLYAAEAVADGYLKVYGLLLAHA